MLTLRTTSFRVLSLAFALLLAVGFGAWQQILSPWVVVPDAGGHGWPRTPELHRVADSAASLLFLMLAVALVVLAVRPRGRSGLAAWTGLMFALTGAFAWVSAALQDHEVQPALVTSAVWLGLTALVFLVLHPEPRRVLGGGVSADDGPTARVRLAAVGVTVIGLALTVGALTWRLAGGVFEERREDDVMSLVYLGVAWAIAGWMVRSGRAGWLTLWWIVLASVAYAVVGGASLLLM